MSIISSIKGLFRSMLPTRTIESVLDITLAISGEELQAIQEWNEAYLGKASWVNADTPSLRSSKITAAEMARNTTNKLESIIEGNADLNRNWQEQVIKKANDTQERANKGGALLLWVSGANEAEKQLIVSRNDAGTYLPVRYDNTGRLVDVVIVTQIRKGDRRYNLLTHAYFEKEQGLEVGRYTVDNKAFVSSDDSTLGSEISLSEVLEWKNLETSYYFDTVQPWFVEMMLPNKEAVFANALDTERKIDEQAARLETEVTLGETMIFTPHGLLKRDENGNVVLPRGKERMFVGSVDQGEKPYTHSPALRISDGEAYLQILKREYEDIVGATNGMISRREHVEKRKAEVEFTQRRWLITINTQRDSFTFAHYQLAYIMQEAGQVYGLWGNIDIEVTFQFGDVVRTEEEREQEYRSRLEDMLTLYEKKFVSWAEVRAYIEEFSEYFTKIPDDLIAEAEGKRAEIEGDAQESGTDTGAINTINETVTTENIEAENIA